MTKMRWPAPRNPNPYARSAAREKQIAESGREGRMARAIQSKEDRAVLGAMPAAASDIATRTGLPLDRVGAALSRLKNRGQAVRCGKEWTVS